MIKFKSFPPVPGEIEFDERFVDFEDMAESEKPSKQYKDLGKHVGSILIANMATGSQVRVFEAATRLMTDHPHAFTERDANSSEGAEQAASFMHGVLDSIMESIEIDVKEVRLL